MSVLTTTCIEINKRATNASKSKQLWTFSKSPRFESINSYTQNIKFPELKESKNTHRGASIGYGDRSDFCLRKNKFKCDNFYDIPSQFINNNRVNNSGSPCHSFGRRPVNSLKLYDKNVKFNYKPGFPGPGDYTINSISSAPKYSLKGRNYYNKRLDKIPGPEYLVPSEINNEGKYIKSNKRNLEKIIFGNQREKRFEEVIKKEKTPGPGNYDIKLGLGDKADKLKKITKQANSFNSINFKNMHLEKGKLFNIILILITLKSSWTWSI